MGKDSLHGTHDCPQKDSGTFIDMASLVRKERKGTAASRQCASSSFCMCAYLFGNTVRNDVVKSATKSTRAHLGNTKREKQVGLQDRSSPEVFILRSLCQVPACWYIDGNRWFLTVRDLPIVKQQKKKNRRTWFLNRSAPVIRESKRGFLHLPCR